MEETRQQPVQHLRILGFCLSTGAGLDGGAVVKLVGEDEVFDCFGVRVSRKVVVEERDVAAVISSIISIGYQCES